MAGEERRMISLRSDITKKLLNYFFMNPQEVLYVNELSRKLSLEKRNLVKKLRELEREGILKSQQRGNLKLCSINKKYPLYNEYKKIILKTMGFESKLRETLSVTEGVEEAYIYGSYARDRLDVHSDIDVLVVGEHKITSLQKQINKLQREIDREINVINMDRREFKKRMKSKDSFVYGVIKGRNIRLIR